jgi:hypothetical protein
MRINNECARKVLMEIEKIPYGKTITVEELCNKLHEFSSEDIIHITTIYNRERYITLIDRMGYDDNDLLRDNRIKGLSERGYKFFDLIRSDETWNLMKNKMNDFNDLSIFTIVSIANKIINTKHNALFNLPENNLVDYFHW